MYKISSAWKSNTPCEGCSTRLNVLSRKKLCFFCKNYFCLACIIQQPDKKMCCKKCQILTATPLDRNDLLNLRSRDLVNYLASRHISRSGCVEKEDLVNVLMGTANYSGSSSSNPHNNFSESCGSNLCSNSQENCIRQPPPSSDYLYSQDGIRITGRNLPENSTASDCQASSQEVDESDWVIMNQNVENDENVGQNQAIIPGFEDTSVESNVQEVNERQDNEANSKFKKEMYKPLQLSDITCLADLENLSIRDLKLLLMANRTDFKGCIERGELLEKANRLWTDYSLSRKDIENLSLEELCKICMDAPIECVLLECGHMATCMVCGKQLSECPVCRQFVIRCVRTFKV